jgi:hypothetical protein
LEFLSASATQAFYQKQKTKISESYFSVSTFVISTQGNKLVVIYILFFSFFCEVKIPTITTLKRALKKTRAKSNTASSKSNLGLKETLNSIKLKCGSKFVSLGLFESFK